VTTEQRRPLVTLVKVVAWLVVAAVVLVLLFTVVFPWVEDRLNQDPTLDGHRPSAGALA
jgi:uncharacterized membrane protein YjfL (UPF0719 family)